MISPDFDPSADIESTPSQLDVIDGEAALTLLVSQHVEKCFTAEELKPDERLIIVLPVKTNKSRLKVVKRADDILTAQELTTHKGEVNKAIHAELKLWIDFKVMEKCLRSRAKNTMTSRFVCKWKFVPDGHGGQVRTIRARLAVRGFSGPRQVRCGYLCWHSQPPCAAHVGLTMRRDDRMVAHDT